MPIATDSMTDFAPSGTRLVTRLGVGSVFEVALVRDEHERELVCKRASPQVRAAFGDSALHRERDVLLAAKSPYLAELVAHGSDDRGGFLLEAPARGTAVRTLVRETEPALDAASWLALARASSHALSSLHALRDERGPLSFVHGDVSPDNLFFDGPTHATFIDLSSATFRDAALPVFQGDRGTLPYVAPELARGESAPSAASDTYALAATLLAVAVGPTITRATTDASRLLEVGESGVDAARIERRQDLPERARRAIHLALVFDRAHRLASSRDLARELQNQVG